MHHANALLNVFNVLKYRRQCRVHAVCMSWTMLAMRWGLTACWRFAGVVLVFTNTFIDLARINVFLNCNDLAYLVNLCLIGTKSIHYDLAVSKAIHPQCHQ